MRALLLVALLCGCTTQAHAPPPAPAQNARFAPRDIAAFFDCLRQERATLIAAHRGGPAPGFAENSIETFAHTFAAAPVLMEIDIALTSDGALVLMHDDSVDRTTDGQGRVSDLTDAQVRALHLRDPSGQTLDAHPPSLRQALDWAAGKTILELDMKRGTPFERVVEEVRAAGAENRVIVIVYNDADAISISRLDPHLMISTPIAHVRELDAFARAHVDLAHVLAWTGVDEPNSELNIALAHRGVEALFGAQTHFDDRFARDGDVGYGAMAETGIQVIVSDRPAEAQRALDAADGPGWAAQRCAGP